MKYRYVKDFERSERDCREGLIITTTFIICETFFVSNIDYNCKYIYKLFTRDLSFSR